VLVSEAEAVGFQRQQAQALALAEMSASVSGRGEGEQFGHRAHELAVQVGDLLLAGAVACNLGIGLDNRGRWPEALEWYARAEAHFTRAGSAWSVALAALNRSTILAELGDIDGATHACTDAHRELAAANVPALAWIASSHLARVRARAGRDVAGQAAVLGRSIERLEELGEEEAARFRQAALVEVLLLARDAPAALAEHLGRRLLALALRSSDRGDDAARTLADALVAARALDAPPEVCLCLHVKGLLAHDHHAELPSAEHVELARLEHELGMVSYPLITIPASA
jgi:tetratricopeptide (TPR) repeat protein